MEDDGYDEHGRNVMGRNKQTILNNDFKQFFMKFQNLVLEVYIPDKHIDPDGFGGRLND